MTGLVSRRGFLASSIAGAASLTVAAPRLEGAVRRRADWIPSDEMMDALPELMRLASVPAVSIAVVEDGAIAWSRTLGIRQAGTDLTADENTLFEAASLSKPTVAYVALLLVREGVLALDEPLATYLAPEDLVRGPAAQRITPRHVLSHTSGLPNWRAGVESDFAPAFEPGSRFSYSGEGYVWLQRVLERITDSPFCRLMRARLLDRAGMQSSTFLWSPSIEHRATWGHGSRGDAIEPFGARLARRMHEIAAESGENPEAWRFEDVEAVARRLDPDRPTLPNRLVPNAAFSLLTTGRDYASFLVHLMRPAPGAATRGQALLQEMLKPQVALVGPLSWGLGWGLERHDAGSWIWHWGDNGTFKAFVLGDVAAARGIVVFTNGAGGHKLYQRVLIDAVGADPASLIWV